MLTKLYKVSYLDFTGEWVQYERDTTSEGACDAAQYWLDAGHAIKIEIVIDGI